MISYIIPTAGRRPRQLAQTLASIETRPGDEILVIGPSGVAVDDRCRLIPYVSIGGWGGAERNIGMAAASGRYLSFMDDDDVYAPDAREALAQGIAEAAGRPIIFRMVFPNGITLWQRQSIECGQVGTPMIVVPNMPTKLGQWGARYEGDMNFLESVKWAHNEFVWRSEIIAHIGNNPGPHDD
jgi:glycosyltransferase involved in cell wall biosynthesis